MKRLLRYAAVSAAIALLSGCVVAGPPPYGYAYGPAYAYAPAYPAVSVDVGTCFGCGQFHRW
jgi:hypothetical protein